MRRKIYLTDESSDKFDEIKKVSTKRKVKNNSSIKGSLIRKNKIVNKFKEDNMFKSLTKKELISYISLFLVDVILVIFCAKQNIVHYVDYGDMNFFVSKTRYLLWGRNYVNLIIITFFYIYGCVMNRFFLQRRNTKKFLIWFLVSLLVVNVILFLIFTKRVY